MYFPDSGQKKALVMKKSSFVLLLFSFLCIFLLNSGSALAGAILYVGDPEPGLSPGMVSRIPIMVEQAGDEGLAGFELTVTVTSSAQLDVVNGGTNPPGLDPLSDTWTYTEEGITIFFPLKGAVSDPAQNETGLGSDFVV